MRPVTLWPFASAKTLKNWVGHNSAHACVIRVTQQPENKETCDVNYRFDRSSNLHVYQSVFEMRPGFLKKKKKNKCCVLNSVKYRYIYCPFTLV